MDREKRATNSACSLLQRKPDAPGFRSKSGKPERLNFSVGKMKEAASKSQHVFAANRAFGRLIFAAHARAGMTCRARLREEGALRLRCPGPPSPELEAVIINTAGGVAGGDDFAVDIAVEAGARLVVTTAAAEKIYRSIGPDATVDIKLK